MSQQISQDAAALLAVQSTTGTQTGAVAAAKQSMLAFVDEFAARSKGTFAESIATANQGLVASIFADIERKLTTFADNNSKLAQAVEATNASAAGKVSAAG
jgi:hypothetical protein